MPSPSSSALAGKWAVAFYDALIRVKPAILGGALKRLLCIGRRIVEPPTGPRLWLDPGSAFGILVLKNGVYEIEMRRLVEGVLRQGDVFFDVGANEGYFTLCAALHGATVEAFEPQIRLQPVLARNLELNPGTAERVRVHEVALSDREEELELYLASTMNSGMTGVFKGSKSAVLRQPVSGLTLDSVAESTGTGRIRLMKVDCEGFESKVMGGATQLLARKAFDFIAMELHPWAGGDGKGAERCQTIHDQMLAAGYELSKVGEQCIYHLPGLRTDLESLGEIRAGLNWNG